MTAPKFTLGTFDVAVFRDVPGFDDAQPEPGTVNGSDPDYDSDNDNEPEAPPDVPASEQPSQPADEPAAPPGPRPQLCDQFRRELRASAITDATIAHFGPYTETNVSTIAERLNRNVRSFRDRIIGPKELGPALLTRALCLPCRKPDAPPDAAPCSYRYKVLPPLPAMQKKRDSDGAYVLDDEGRPVYEYDLTDDGCYKPAKYLSPSRSQGGPPPPMYILTAPGVSLVELLKSDMPVLVAFTEGWKKAVALLQCGFGVVIALDGIYGFGDSDKRKAHQHEHPHSKRFFWHPDIERYIAPYLKGRKIVIAFDRSAKPDPQERHAAKSLAKLCYGSGAAEVRNVVPPSIDTKGVDDFYALHARRDGAEPNLSQDAAVAYNLDAGRAAVLELIEQAAVLPRTAAKRGGTQPLDGNAPPSAGTGADWESQLTRSDNDAIKPSTRNLALIFRCHDMWRGRLRYNSRSTESELLPGSPISGATHTQPRALSDVDSTLASIWLGDVYDIDVAPDSSRLLGAMRVVAAESPVDPFVEWLDEQRWDGVPRIDTWLSTYCGAEDTLLHRAFGARFLIAGVARARKPGTKVDTMLIFEGAQGRLKSTAAEALCPDDSMFTDDCPPDLSEKDAKLHLLGKLIVEIAELDALKKTGTAALKGFLSRKTDKFRPPYGRHDIAQPRRCVFFGTTNHSQYLHDSTGGRRFWPVKIERCDAVGIRRDRAQLWAEAAVRQQRGERHWINDSEYDLLNGAAAAAESRREVDPWESRILAHIATQSTSPGYVLMANLLTIVLDIELNRQSPADAQRVKKILISAGWVLRRPSVKDDREGVKRQRRYYPSDTAVDDDAEVEDVELDASAWRASGCGPAANTSKTSSPDSETSEEECQ